MDKRKIIIIISIIFLCLCVCENVFAYTYTKPEGSYYINCTTSQLGIITICIPSDMVQYFTFTAEYPINISSNTVYGYIIGTQKVIRFYPFRYPEYSSGYEYETLTITSVNDTNLKDINLSSSDRSNSLIILILGVIAFCLFMNH